MNTPLFLDLVHIGRDEPLQELDFIATRPEAIEPENQEAGV